MHESHETDAGGRPSDSRAGGLTVTTRRFTAARACIADVAAIAREIPLFPVERTMRLAGLAAARQAAAEPPALERIGWAAIFMKAYAHVARDMPILRSWLVRGFPGAAFGIRPRLATCSESVATLALNRVADGDDRLLWARLARPDTLPLSAIQQFIADCGTKPIEEVCRRQLQLEMVPGPLRRTILRWNMNSTSPKRASRIGTYSLSTLAGLGATNRFHPTICTTSLSYAPIDPEGGCLVTLIADHRVLDGAAAARALAALEETLTGRMREELLAVAALRPPANRPQAAA